MFMVGTFSEEQYMALNEAESKACTEPIIRNVWNWGGEISLLWHNNASIGADCLNWNNYMNCLVVIEN